MSLFSSFILRAPLFSNGSEGKSSISRLTIELEILLSYHILLEENSDIKKRIFRSVDEDEIMNTFQDIRIRI